MKKLDRILFGVKRPKRMSMLGDFDGDGVPNAFDCKPRDKNKQGIIDDIKSRIKEKSQERKESKVAGRIIRKKARAEGFRAKEEFAIKYAREKERIKSEGRISRLKKKQQSGGFIGFLDRATRPPTTKKPVIRKMTRKPKRKSIKRRTTKKAKPQSFDFGF